MKLNGNIKISETNKTLNDLVDSTNDSGWIYPTLNSGWTEQYIGAKTRYRKIGKIVFLESFVSKSSNAGNLIFTLPVGYRPITVYTRYPAYSQHETVTINISNNGQVQVLSNSATLTWVSINCSFITD